VCEITDLKPHVLRYWETQFKGLAPVKNRAGNRAYRKREIEMVQLDRAYRKREIEMVQLVKELLYEQKYTIEGARQRLAEMRKGSGQLSVELDEARVKDTFETLARDLGKLIEYVDAFHRGDVEPGEGDAD
jgi:DNA-binding transcriptional MerR regulator